MSLNWVYSGRSCDFNKQGRNTKHVRMFQAMPLEYLKDDGFNCERFKMTKNDYFLIQWVILMGHFGSF